MKTKYKVDFAVLIPCHNEEKSIGKVLLELTLIFKPDSIFVGLNACSDKTLEIAKKFNVVTISNNSIGKGNMVRTLFESIDAKTYLLIDGDSTYSTEKVLDAIEYFNEKSLMMLIGKRITSDNKIFRKGHFFGNKLMTIFSNFFLGTKITDSLSGFRILSETFVKTFNSSSKGFEIESDFNSHASVIGGLVSEYPIKYFKRPQGSFSKLRTFSDGIKIATNILRLGFRVRPLQSFIIISLPWLFLAIFGIVRSLNQYFKSGEIPNYPSLIGGVGSFLVFSLLVTCGIIVNRMLIYKSEVIKVFARNFN